MTDSVPNIACNNTTKRPYKFEKFNSVPFVLEINTFLLSVLGTKAKHKAPKEQRLCR